MSMEATAGAKTATIFTRLELALSLTVASPFLFRGLAGRLLGLDAAALRNEEGRPIIPADQVRGCLRDAFEDLAAAGTGITDRDILDLFGRQSPGSERGAGAENKPFRGRLIVSDLTAKGLDAAPLETTRIEIDNDTGAVEEGKMQVIELAAKFGKEVVFAGTATLFVAVGAEELWERRLGQALALITAIGAVKTAGYGEVVEGSVTRLAATRASVPAAPAAAVAPVRRRYRVTFDRPVLVDAEWIADNAMQGSAVVPGAVFKGALAQALVYAGEDPERGSYSGSLAALSIGHAFPEIGDTKEPGGLPLPLSLVTVAGKSLDGGQGDGFGDALFCPDGQGVLMLDERGEKRPALFPGDWKDAWFGNAYAALGRAPVGVPLVPRTHTSINHAGVATDRALFTTLARSVRRCLTGPDDKRTWVDRSWILDVASDGTALSISLLARLEQGLDGIGKTGAHARFDNLGATPAEVLAEIAGHPGEYAVMLVTPAHILDAGNLVVETDSRPAWRMCAHDAYAAYWNKHLPGAKLESFFARQRYTGGYLARRRRAHGDKHYHPFLLTEAGSVFRLSQVTGSVLVTLEELCRSGLPPADIGGAPATWKTCPYVRENGYGRITANHLSGPTGSRLMQAVRYE